MRALPRPRPRPRPPRRAPGSADREGGGDPARTGLEHRVATAKRPATAPARVLEGGRQAPLEVVGGLEAAVEEESSEDGGSEEEDELEVFAASPSRRRTPVQSPVGSWKAEFSPKRPPTPEDPRTPDFRDRSEPPTPEPLTGEKEPAPLPRPDNMDFELRQETARVELGGLGTSAQGHEDSDDEFDYAFDGEAREMQHHVPEFKAPEMPARLVSHIGADVRGDVLIEEAEDDEELDTSLESGAVGLTPEKAGAAGAADGADGADGAAQPPDEWEVANSQFRAEQAARSAAAATAGEGGPAQPQRHYASIHYTEAFKHFSAADLSAHAGQVTVAEEAGPCGGALGCFGACFGPGRLAGDLEGERERVFALAKVQLDDGDEVHLRVLQSIYMRLAGTRTNVARREAHWEDVGFQGQDPATDLRGCGMFGLLQLVFLLTYSPQSAQTLYALSRDEYQQFPLTIVSINVSKWALQALRSGLLNRHCNKLGSVFAAANKFYLGAFYEFYYRWKAGGATMTQSGFVLKEVEDYAKRAVAKMVEQSEQTLGVQSTRERRAQKQERGAAKEAPATFSEF